MTRSKQYAALLMSAFSLALASPVSGQGLTFERWNSVASPSILILQRDAVNVRVPNSTQTVNLAEIPSNAADSYGGRLRGWVTAPQTGDYTFFVAGDDSAELWLSPDNSRFNRQLIAFSRNPTTARQWNKFASQRSQVVRLVQGESYYLEAWMKESISSDHLAVGWHRVGVPTYTSSNWASATGTWTGTTPGGYTFSVASGGLGGTSDSASRTARSWTGDGEFVVNLEQLAGSTNTAQAGLMLRIDAAANGRHVYIGRNVGGQSAFVRRTTVGGNTTTTLGALNGNYLRLVRAGNTISASVSTDGVQWVSAGTGVTITSLPSTLEVSLVAAAVTANPATPVTGTFGPLTARPLVATEVIPGANLTPNAADPADTGDKGIPDAWQVLNGLVPSQRFGANGPYGDPDADGLLNFQEYAFGFNPYEADSINGLISRELWTNIPGINQVVDLTNHNRFFETPDAINLVSGIDFYFGGETTNSFGARYRGQVTAPKTGYYRFWVTAPDDAQLWLADGSIKRPGESQGMTSRFGKRKIASVWGAGYFTSRAARYDFDSFACQRSERIWLAEGEKYYFEVLHKTRSHEMNHVSVAWQPPGESRALIPATAFSHHLPSPLDADDDYLPDSWETTVGLNPALNGRTDRKQAQDGDWDGDLLSNLREYQLGTNPKNSDSDGDGISDADEVNYYKSDPLVSNNLAPVVVATIAPGTYSSATGRWMAEPNGQLSAWDQRGEVSYSFTVVDAGVHEVRFTGAAIGGILVKETLPLVFSLDGRVIAQRNLVSVNGGAATVKVLTPWLTPGTYSLGILHDNYVTARRLRVDAISVHRLGGLDANEDGVPDWIKQNADNANKFTSIPAASRVSPVSVEGKAEELASATLQRLPVGSSVPEPVDLQASINSGFFANVPLTADGATTITAHFLGGLVEESHSVDWIATNLFNHEVLEIRAGDSLRLDAWSGESPSGTFTVSLGGNLMADGNGTTSHTAGVPFVATFGTAGTFTLTASHASQTHAVTVKVHAANFGPSQSVRIFSPRKWIPSLLGQGITVEGDETLGLIETSGASRSFSVSASEEGDRYVLARVPEGADGAPGAIIARGTVKGFYLAYLDETKDPQVVAKYEDGTWVMQGTIVAVGLPEDILIRLYINYQGATFANGSNTLWLSSADFDANGVATVLFEWTGTGAPRLCNNLKLFVRPPSQ